MTEENKAKLIYRDQVFEVVPGQQIRKAVEACGLTPEAVLPVRDGELVLDTEYIRIDDEITLVAVISGGMD